MNIILASQSPRRKIILSRLLIPFQVLQSNFIEEEYTRNETPEGYSQRLATGKAVNVANKNPDDLVIGADTIVVLDKNVLGKPKDKKEANEFLNRLSGNTHFVITAVSIQIKNKNINHTFFVKTAVTFYPLNQDDIDLYVNSCNPLDKAGSYGIQDYSGIFVEKIDGCYDNVVGFPLAQFYLEIKKLGVNLNEPNYKNIL